MQETHYLDKPFYFLYWVYTNLQDTNAELMGGSSVPISKKNAAERGSRISPISQDAPLPGEKTHSLERCEEAAIAVWSPDRDALCLSYLNSSSKVTFILNKDTEIIRFLVWFIV